MKQYAFVVPKVFNFTMANKLYFMNVLAQSCNKFYFDPGSRHPLMSNLQRKFEK